MSYKAKIFSCVAGGGRGERGGGGAAERVALAKGAAEEGWW